MKLSNSYSIIFKSVLKPCWVSLITLLSTTAQAQNPIEQFIEPSTCCVVRLDLQRTDLPGSLHFLQEEFPGQIPVEASSGVMGLVGGAIGSLKSAGANEIYFTLSTVELLSGKATVIVPTADPDAVAPQLQSLIGILPPVFGYSVHKTRDAVVACTEPVWTRLQSTTVGSHPALSEAMVFAPSSHMALAVSFRQDLRSSAALVWPDQLPRSFPMQLAVKQLIQDIQLVRLDITSGSQFAFELSIVCEAPAAAVRTNEQLSSLLQQFEIALPPADLRGDKVVLSLDHGEAETMAQKLSAQFTQQVAWMQESNNLKQLGLAVYYFQQKYDGLPPRMTVTGDGKPLLSWRVHLLPFIEQQQLYDQFHLDEPWSSPHNRSLIEKMPASFENLLHPELEAGLTCVQLPLVEGSFWNGTEQRWLSLTDIPDGTSNTVCFVVAPKEKAVVWTKPEDLQLDTTDIVGSLFFGRDRMHITLFDSSVQEIDSSTTVATLRAWLTAAGNEQGVPQF